MNGFPAMVLCEGCRETMVREGAGYCDACLAIDCQLEAKRRFDANRMRAYGVGAGRELPPVLEVSEVPRMQAGVGCCPEDADLLTFLASARRDRAHYTLLFAGVVVVLGLLATPWFVGCIGIWQHFFGR